MWLLRKRRTDFWNIFKYKSVCFSLFVSFCLSIVSMILMRCLPLLITNDIHILMRNICLIFLLYVLQNILLFLRLYTSQVAQYYLRRGLASDISNHFLEIGIEQYNDSLIGEKTSLYINDTNQLLVLLFQKILDITYYLTILLAGFWVLLSINLYIFLLTLGMIFPLVFIPKLFEKKLVNAINISQIAKSKYLGSITSHLFNLPMYVRNQSSNLFLKKMNYESELVSRKISDSDIFASKMTGILNFSSEILILCNLSLAGFLIIRGEFKSEFMLSLLGVLPLIGEASQMIITNLSFYKSGQSFFCEKFEDISIRFDEKLTNPLIKRNRSDDRYSCNSSMTRLSRIELKNVVLNYSDKDIFFKDYVFEEGKKYLIIGDSGCGKSSLLKLIIGECSRYTGDVLVDGKIKLKDEQLYNSIAFLGSEPYVFSGTLEENIALGKKIFNWDEILTLVGLTSFSLDDEIEENGANLSEGQKQKISLARVIMSQKKIFFLDEVTANLDQCAKERIEQFFWNSDAMVIYITHQPNKFLIDNSDEIIYM